MRTNEKMLAIVDPTFFSRIMEKCTYSLGTYLVRKYQLSFFTFYRVCQRFRLKNCDDKVNKILFCFRPYTHYVVIFAHNIAMKR